jgi:hypothetical protein
MDSIYLPYTRDGTSVSRLVTAFVFNQRALQARRRSLREDAPAVANSFMF